MFKRSFDLIISAAGLLLLAPLFLLIAIVIILTSGFPVFFRQQRVGRHGRLFQILKFRSMHTGARGASITAGGDHRITGIGRLLRRYMPPRPPPAPRPPPPPPRPARPPPPPSPPPPPPPPQRLVVVLEFWGG